MKIRNERTSPRVAKIAAKVLAYRTDPDIDPRDLGVSVHHGCGWDVPGLHWSDIRALAASALTQAPDKPKRKAKRSR